jgi:hypothetical protein
MQNTQNLPPRPFQEAQGEIPKEKAKKSVSSKSNRKNKRKSMRNTQNLPPRPFQEAQAEISKEKEKKSVSTKSNQKK